MPPNRSELIAMVQRMVAEMIARRDALNVAPERTDGKIALIEDVIARALARLDLL